MNHFTDILKFALDWVVPGCVAVWLMIRCLKRTDDPARLIFKWILTVPVIVGFVLIRRFLSRALVGGLDYGAAFFAVIGTTIVALYFAAIWRHQIAALIAKPFASIYDGGNEEIDPKPFYSIAHAQRKRGRYTEAVATIRAQLAKFPDDVEGQMLLAEIQAENLNDLPGAELTVQRLCDQPDHTPQSLAFALNSLADWHLRFGQDREAARRDLEKIIALLPDTEPAAVAAQRIGHLASTDQMLATHDRKRIVLTPGVEDLGLASGAVLPKPPEMDPGQQAAAYVKQLAAHPLDTEAREKLAVIYADHFHRLDLAADQLNQLIESPNQPAKRVTHWLNLLADLQVHHGGNYDDVRGTLQRIVDLYPKSGAAGQAATRLAHLRLELKGKETNQPVKLGSYEDDVGLRSGPPKRGSADQL